MPVTMFYSYQIGVYAAVILISFLLAWFFWRKGDAVISGKVPGTQTVTWKLTGAAAIFAVTLFALQHVNPLHSLSDYRNVVLLAYGNAGSEDLGKEAIYHIDAETLKGMTIDKNKVVIEIVRVDAVTPLLPSAHNRFETERPLAPGRYRLRVFQGDSGQWEQKFVTLPLENTGH